MKSIQRGLTLIEVAIALTFAGSLATIAVPAYRDYVTREKVVQVLATAAPAKSTVEDYVKANGHLPSTSAISLPFANSKYVLSTAWAASGASGAITVSTRSPTSGDEKALGAKVVMLTATYMPKAGRVEWKCGGDATTVNGAYLPPDCR